MSPRADKGALPDAGARRRAATDFATNLVMEAGAGTGKTSLLVERVLTAVGMGVMEITGLAAITFTEKAAGEMRQRMARELERLLALAQGGSRGERDDSEADRAFTFLTAESGIDAAEVAGRALAALESLDRATVVTIHAFCSELLRAHPLEAGVDPEFRVDRGEHEATLVTQAWEEFVTRELGPRPPRPELWRELLRKVTPAAMGALGSKLAGFGFPLELLDSPDAWNAGREALAELATRLRGEIETLFQLAGGITPKTRAYFEEMAALLDALRDEGAEGFRRAVGAYPEIVRRVENKKATPPKATPKLERVPGEVLNRLAATLLRLARDVNAVDDDLVRQAVEAVAPFVREFRERYLRQGLVSFDGLLVLARDLLRDHPSVREAVKRRYAMLLVDEFQDTDPLQYEIVLFLAERPGSSAGDAYAAELEPGRLFIVGDPKQSIYRFRGADYSAYHAAVERICSQGGERQDLVTNFRSLPGVVEPINDLFEAGPASAWTPSDYQPPYTPIRAFRTEKETSPLIEVWTPDHPPKFSADDRRRCEGRLIAEEIERLVDSGEARDYSEISILLRTYSPLAHYLRALRERGIPFVVDGGREFLRRPEVGQLMAALQTLAQPADQAALLAFLRSPSGGVTDDDLARYAAERGRWDWREEPDPGIHPRIADRFDLLRQLAAETCLLPADAVIRRVLERTLLLPLSAAAFEGAQRVANLRKLADTAAELARDGRLSLEEVVEALREGRLGGVEGDSPLADDLARAVRVTSIHRMKGLENRWIFLPDMARGHHGDREDKIAAKLVRTTAGKIVPAIRLDRCHGSAWAWRREEGRHHDAAEETRVLYVALTRAEDRLVLLAAPMSKPNHELGALAPWGYHPDDPPGDGDGLDQDRVLHRRPSPSPGARRESAPASEDSDLAVDAYHDAVARLREEAHDPFASPSAEERSYGPPTADDDPEPGEEPALPVSRDVGKAAGTLVHRLLEEWDGNVEGWPEERVSRLATSTSKERGIDVALLQREVAELLDAFLGSPLAERFREVEIVDRELALIHAAKDGHVWRGSIDLLYRESGGSLVVADYKTDREDDDDRLRESYAGQLGAYARAVQEALELESPPRAELWLVRGGRIIEVE